MLYIARHPKKLSVAFFGVERGNVSGERGVPANGAGEYRLLLPNKFTIHLFPFFVEKDRMLTATAKGEIYCDGKRKNACRTAL